MNLPGRYCKERLFEWAMTLSIVGMGFTLLIWPESMATSKLNFMLDIITTSWLTVAYIVVGSGRGVALYLNSKWPRGGSRVRVFGAGFGGVVWLQMGVSLIFSQKAVGSPPAPSTILYIVLAAAEFYSAYRAASDARH